MLIFERLLLRNSFHFLVRFLCSQTDSVNIAIVSNPSLTRLRIWIRIENATHANGYTYRKSTFSPFHKELRLIRRIKCIKILHNALHYLLSRSKARRLAEYRIIINLLELMQIWAGLRCKWVSASRILRWNDSLMLKPFRKKTSSWIDLGYDLKYQNFHY